VKLTNGTDNDNPPGLLVPVGSTVTWTYQVTNPGNESLAGVAVTDNQPGVHPAPVLTGLFNQGDTNHNNLLDPGEQWLYTATGTAVAGQYANIGTATGTGTVSNTFLTDTNPDHYFGVQPAIHLVKLTNGPTTTWARPVGAGGQHGDLDVQRHESRQRALEERDGHGRSRSDRYRPTGDATPTGCWSRRALGLHGHGDGDGGSVR